MRKGRLECYAFLLEVMKKPSNTRKTRRIEVMDTTLRDGEQAEGISMMPEEKRTIARRLLETVKVDRIEVASARVINLLTKGSLHHCREQLKKTHQQHLDDIRKTIDYGVKHGITFNVYLEDWSGGMLGSEDYVMEHIGALVNMSRAPLRWTSGHVHEAGRHLYVTAGIGTSGVPLRIGVPPEYAVIDVNG